MNLQSLRQPAAGYLLGAVLLALLCPVPGGVAHAEEPGAFVAPKAYPIERYEAGWNKNPFTLKTAPVVAEHDSFAKDLAIGAYYGDAKDPTVVVVNIKTGERIRLKKMQPAANGMQLKNMTLGTSRKEIVAEVTLGAQTSEVRFNDDYLKQIAGAASARTQPGQPSGVPGQQRPGAVPTGQQPKVPVPGTAQSTPNVLLPPLPQGNQGRASGPGYAGSGGQPASTAMAAANRTIGNANPVVTAGNPATSSSDVPMVSRRRLITPATGVQ